MNEPSKDILEYWKPKIKLEEGITKLYNLYQPFMFIKDTLGITA